MHAARVTGRFPTRRPKKRQTNRTVTVLRGEKPDNLTLPAGEAPALLHLPLLKEPAVLTGADLGPGVHIVGLETIAFGPTPDTFTVAQEASGFRQVDDLDATAFVRMLAKIGYSFLVGAFGHIPLPEITVLPLILGQADDGSHWVGSASFSTEAERSGAQHVLVPHIQEDPADPARLLLGARIKLFADAGAAGYEVIVHRNGHGGR